MVTYPGIVVGVLLEEPLRIVVGVDVNLGQSVMCRRLHLNTNYVIIRRQLVKQVRRIGGQTSNAFWGTVGILVLMLLC